MRLFWRRLFGAVAIALGLYLLYAAFWVFSEVVGSPLKLSGWSVTGTSMILNYAWRGNEIYLLISLYLGVGSALLTGGFLAWKRPRRPIGKKNPA